MNLPPILKPGSIDYQFTEDVNRRQLFLRISRAAAIIALFLLVVMAFASTFMLGYTVGLSNHH